VRGWCDRYEEDRMKREWGLGNLGRKGRRVEWEGRG
jgi:hypothetical protein